MNLRRTRDSLCLPLLIAAVTLLAPTASRGSSHSDAPLIKQDPQANLTDIYAFIGTKYDDPGQRVLNVLVSVRPFSEPGDGVMYDRLADDALYSIHVTNPATGTTVDRYDFRFSSITGPLKNPGTILSYGLGTELGPITTIGDARQNFTQTYSVYRNGTLLASGIGACWKTATHTSDRPKIVRIILKNHVSLSFNQASAMLVMTSKKKTVFIIHALGVFCAPKWLVVFLTIEYSLKLKKGRINITIIIIM